MVSLRAKLLEKLLPLTGLKPMFSDPEKLAGAVPKMRQKGAARPGSLLYRQFDIERRDLRGHPIYLLSRKGGSNRRIIYIHGGAYVLDLQPGYWSLVKDLARQTGAAVEVPCYPLTPEDDFEYGYAWMMQVYDEAVSAVGAHNVTLMGDSAGAGFALGMAQLLRDQGKPMPGRVALLSPWLDVTVSDPRQAELEAKDRILGIDGIRAAGKWWAGENGSVDAAPVSPIHGSLDDLPPLGVFTGTSDLLWPDAVRLKEKAAAQNIPLTYVEYPDMQHVWMLFPIPEAKKVRQEIADFVEGRSDPA